MLSSTGTRILEVFYNSLQASDYKTEPGDYHMEGFIGDETHGQEWLLLCRDEVEEFLRDCVDEDIQVETDFETLFVERGGVL